jgi:hypothetical protein
MLDAVDYRVHALDRVDVPISEQDEGARSNEICFGGRASMVSAW